MKQSYDYIEAMKENDGWNDQLDVMQTTTSTTCSMPSPNATPPVIKKSNEDIATKRARVQFMFPASHWNVTSRGNLTEYMDIGNGKGCSLFALQLAASDAIDGRTKLTNAVCLDHFDILVKERGNSRSMVTERSLPDLIGHHNGINNMKFVVLLNESEDILDCQQCQVGDVMADNFIGKLEEKREKKKYSAHRKAERTKKRMALLQKANKAKMRKQRDRITVDQIKQIDRRRRKYGSSRPLAMDLGILGTSKRESSEEEVVRFDGKMAMKFGMDSLRARNRKLETECAKLKRQIIEMQRARKCDFGGNMFGDDDVKENDDDLFDEEDDDDLEVLKETHVLQSQHKMEEDEDEIEYF